MAGSHDCSPFISLSQLISSPFHYSVFCQFLVIRRQWTSSTNNTVCLSCRVGTAPSHHSHSSISLLLFTHYLISTDSCLPRHPHHLHPSSCTGVRPPRFLPTLQSPRPERHAPKLTSLGERPREAPQVSPAWQTKPNWEQLPSRHLFYAEMLHKRELLQAGSSLEILSESPWNVISSFLLFFLYNEKIPLTR